MPDQPLSSQSQRNCWLRGRQHGPFVEYDPPYAGTAYVFPHYRCECCGHRVSLLMGAFMRPVEKP